MKNKFFTFIFIVVLPILVGIAIYVNIFKNANQANVSADSSITSTRNASQKSYTVTAQAKTAAARPAKSTKVS